MEVLMTPLSLPSDEVFPRCMALAEGPIPTASSPTFPAYGVSNLREPDVQVLESQVSPIINSTTSNDEGKNKTGKATTMTANGTPTLPRSKSLSDILVSSPSARGSSAPVAKASTSHSSRRGSYANGEDRSRSSKYKDKKAVVLASTLLSSALPDKVVLRSLRLAPESYVHFSLSCRFLCPEESIVSIPSLSLPPDGSFFRIPTKRDHDSYDKKAADAVRSRDVAALRRMLREEPGRSFHACNLHGESLLSMACRRGSLDVVRFLLQEANVNPRMMDDVGRNPLHDACWTPRPEHELVELLIRAEPMLLLMSDRRGHVPMAYVRKEDWGGWVRFLASRRVFGDFYGLEMHEGLYLDLVRKTGASVDEKKTTSYNGGTNEKSFFHKPAACGGGGKGGRRRRHSAQQLEGLPEETFDLGREAVETA